MILEDKPLKKSLPSVRTFFLYLVSVLFLIHTTSCEPKERETVVKLKGNTQGTTFHITYLDSQNQNVSDQIDSLLKIIDTSLSTYNKESLISKVNNSTDSIIPVDNHFFNVISKSFEIYRASNGRFDPTIKPLVDYWGFGTENMKKRTKVDTLVLDSIINLVGLNKLEIGVFNSPDSNNSQKYFVKKLKSGVKLDFNAIAQGYSVDVIANYFTSQNIVNFMVEIGGEVRANGRNGKGELWRIGIDKPLTDPSLSRELQATLNLNNQSVATSGNYRKYYNMDNRLVSHVIDPKTGYSNIKYPLIVSATVVSSDCMAADGYATALLVSDLATAIQILENNDQLEGYIIYVDSLHNFNTYTSPGVKNNMKLIGNQ